MGLHVVGVGIIYMDVTGRECCAPGQKGSVSLVGWGPAEELLEADPKHPNMPNIRFNSVRCNI